MVSTFCQWTIGVQDLDLMATFWSGALGYHRHDLDSGATQLRPPRYRPESVLTVLLHPVTAATKEIDNGNHPDLLVPDGDLETEARRLISLGATRAEAGRCEHDPFIVLADPEGNAFCLVPRRPAPCD